MSHRLDVMHLGGVGVGGWGGSSLCSPQPLSVQFLRITPHVKEVRTKPLMIAGEQQIKEIIEGGSRGERVSSAKLS